MLNTKYGPTIEWHGREAIESFLPDNLAACTYYCIGAILREILPPDTPLHSIEINDVEYTYLKAQKPSGKDLSAYRCSERLIEKFPHLKDLPAMDLEAAHTAFHA